jgi:hypothetical protein
MTRSTSARWRVAVLVCLVVPRQIWRARRAGREDDEAADCRSAPSLGRFEPATDLLIANFDNKPDTDDLLAAAGLTTMLRDERFACVRSIATTGAYGNNPGTFIDASALFDLAFGDAWVDAHADRAAAVTFLADRALATLRAGGDVWIMEAGQSDVTAAAARHVIEAEPAIDLRSRIHLVQHSAINEAWATPSALTYVQDRLDYIKIADGNTVGNGTPGFNTRSDAAWPDLLADPASGPVWAEARRTAVEVNPTTGFENDAIAAGGLDFSDLVEATYIFGFEDLVDAEDFVAEFVSPLG